MKYGIVSEVDAAKGMARVNFQEDEMVSYWLPILMRKTLQEKESFPLDVNEHVVCLLDEHCEFGVILGSIYSQADLPGITSPDQFGTSYQNGDYFKYDRASQKYEIKTGNTYITTDNNSAEVRNGSLSIKLDTNSGITEISNGASQISIGNSGLIEVTNGPVSLRQILDDILTQIQAITLPVTNGGTPVGTAAPVANAASFIAIQTQLATLLQ